MRRSTTWVAALGLLIAGCQSESSFVGSPEANKAAETSLKPEAARSERPESPIKQAAFQRSETSDVNPSPSLPQPDQWRTSRISALRDGYTATHANQCDLAQASSMRTTAQRYGTPTANQPHFVDQSVATKACSETRGEAGSLPRELAKVSLPPYIIEPPDILLIDAVRLVPRPPYKLEPMDMVGIQVADTLPNQPIAGTYTVAPEGTVSLGYSYGTLPVIGMSVQEAEMAIGKHLGRILQNPQVAVTLLQFRGLQQTRGEHLVRPDGTISLGSYGGVYVAGLTIDQAKVAIEQQLSHCLLNPEISLDIFAYNSKVYYVVTDGAGYGEQVFRFPVTGNETVLDAISQIYGLPAVASKRKIWIARPAPCDSPCDQVIPVDWRAIVEGGSTCTNYQIFPGDRIYVKADCLIHADNFLAKIIAPVERVLGITLLGSATVNSVRLNGTAAAAAVPVIP